jgi:hypothetical protein
MAKFSVPATLSCRLGTPLAEHWDMSHAATASMDDRDARDAAQYRPREFSAFLRLRQGGAARATWLLTEAAGGTMISVGTDSACDWQIRAAFVPARAFSVLVVGGRAFVRSGHEPGLLVNGKPVGNGWVSLPQNARIDIGLARIEVVSGYADELSAQGTDEPRWLQPHVRAVPAQHAYEPYQPPEPVVPQGVRQPTLRTPAHFTGVKRPKETQEYRFSAREAARPVQVVRDARELDSGERPVMHTRPVAAKPAKVNNSTIELKLEDLDYAGTIPLPGRVDDREYQVSPSLLEGDQVTRVTGRSRSWRLLAAAALFSGAYGAWLYLLDRI